MFRILASAALIVFFCGVRANAGFIDKFDTHQIVVVNSGIPIDGNVTSGADIVGVEREIGLVWLSGPNDIVLEPDAGGTGLLNLSVGADTSGNGAIVWDGADGSPLLDPTGLGGIDLTGGGMDRIGIDVVFDDLPVDLVLQVYTDAANWSQALVQLPGGIAVPVRMDALYSAFNVVAGSGADFSNVGAIVLAVDNMDPATDLQIDLIEWIPEPATLGLLALGGLALLRRRRA
ncbi:MAG: PEP-CTERM sorting domain-containing protein [Planctomycetota bacterium]|jgi:hypothetical protein